MTQAENQDRPRRRGATRQKLERPRPVDVHVGGRVRLRRTMLGMSQEKLGDAIGLTFQQVQKYERGTNRIGSSRLWELSKVLDVPVSFSSTTCHRRSPATRRPHNPVSRSPVLPPTNPTHSPSGKPWNWCAPTTASETQRCASASSNWPRRWRRPTTPDPQTQRPSRRACDRVTRFLLSY